MSAQYALKNICAGEVKILPGENEKSRQCGNTDGSR
nr:MAG TPA: hypothetical protein [Caudoviricetes sp.]